MPPGKPTVFQGLLGALVLQVHPGILLWEKVSKEGPEIRAVTVAWKPLLSRILWDVPKGTIQFFSQTKVLLRVN